MTFDLNEYAQLAVRWFHIFAGILWIGSTWYFTWLDRQLHKAPEGVWMVHSGGFYQVQKLADPRVETSKIHWFRFEALLTWLSGLVLLGLVYYWGGLMTYPEGVTSALPPWVIGIATIVLGWIVYDLFWVALKGKYDLAGYVACYLALVAVTWALTRVLDGRAAYIHIGAMLGTIMVLNVWMRILPNQKKLVAAVSRGEKPDARLAEQAKNRSKHNTFIIMPVLITMISNHFPVAIYGSDQGWISFAVLTLIGFGAAKIVRDR